MNIREIINLLEDIEDTEPQVGDIVEMECGDTLIETTIAEVTEDGVVLHLDETGVRILVDGAQALLEGKTGPGLWANIHAKRERGERMRKKGDPGAPTEKALKAAQAGSKNESVAEGTLNEGYIVKNGSKYLKGHPAGGVPMTWVTDKAKATVFKSKGEISRAANMRGWSIIPAQQGVAEGDKYPNRKGKWPGERHPDKEGPFPGERHPDKDHKKQGVAEGRDNPLQDIDPRGWNLIQGDRPIAINFPDEHTAKSFHSGHGYGRETKVLHGSQVRQNAYLKYNPSVINYPEYSKGVAEDEHDDYENNKLTREDAIIKMVERLAKQGIDPTDKVKRAFSVDEHELDEIAEIADPGYPTYQEWLNSFDKIDEAKYRGREVPLGKPMAGDVAKRKVYVKGPKGNVVKVNFGQKGVKIKKNNPGRRKSFRARHGCDNPGPRWRAKYWSCKMW